MTQARTKESLPLSESEKQVWEALWVLGGSGSAREILAYFYSNAVSRPGGNGYFSLKADIESLRGRGIIGESKGEYPQCRYYLLRQKLSCQTELGGWIS